MCLCHTHTHVSACHTKCTPPPRVSEKCRHRVYGCSMFRSIAITACPYHHRRVWMCTPMPRDAHAYLHTCPFTSMSLAGLQQMQHSVPLSSTPLVLVVHDLAPNPTRTKLIGACFCPDLAPNSLPCSAPPHIGPVLGRQGCWFAPKMVQVPQLSGHNHRQCPLSFLSCLHCNLVAIILFFNIEFWPWLTASPSAPQPWIHGTCGQVGSRFAQMCTDNK